MNDKVSTVVHDHAANMMCALRMEHLIELRWPVTAVLSDDRVTKCSDRSLDLKSDQWVLAEQLVKVLHPIEVAIAFLSSEENASLSCVLPVIYGLVDALKTVSDLEDELPAIRSIRQKTVKEISDRWGLDSLDTTSSLVLTLGLNNCAS